MVPQRPVPNIGEERLRFVEPLVNGQVVLGDAAIPGGARLRMMDRIHRGMISSSYSEVSTRQWWARRQDRSATSMINSP